MYNMEAILLGKCDGIVVVVGLAGKAGRGRAGARQNGSSGGRLIVASNEQRAREIK